MKNEQAIFIYATEYHRPLSYFDSPQCERPALIWIDAKRVEAILTLMTNGPSDEIIEGPEKKCWATWSKKHKSWIFWENLWTAHSLDICAVEISMTPVKGRSGKFKFKCNIPYIETPVTTMPLTSAKLLSLAHLATQSAKDVIVTPSGNTLFDDSDDFQRTMLKAVGQPESRAMGPRWPDGSF